MIKKLAKFMRALDAYGEMYFSQGSIKADYDYITSVINAQGYYSGCRYRFYFNKDLDLVKVEGRW